MSSRKRSRDRSPAEIRSQPATTANASDVECQSMMFVESSGAKALDFNVVSGNDIENHVSCSGESVEAKSSLNSNGTGNSKLVLPHRPPAIVSAPRFAGREKYVPLQQAESCDKAIISVFGVSGCRHLQCQMLHSPLK
jgi:hypothetical protein